MANNENSEEPDTPEIKPAIHEIIPIIEDWVRFWGYYNEVPGVSLAICQYNEELTCSAFGYADLSNQIKMRPDTRFRIASHSKVFTATAILELYASEKLSLDDKVTKYLDWFEPEEDNIRIRHLLTHTSGITRDGEFGQWHHHKFPNLEQFKSMVDKQEDVEIIGPAVQIKYSNIAYTLLGQVIEEITGKPYKFYMQDLIERLNLGHTTPEIGNNADLHTKGYEMKMPGENRTAFEHVEANVMNSATGFSSIPTDILKFYRAQMLDQDLGIEYGNFFKREMQNLQFKYKDTEWGLGFMRTKFHDLLFLGHGGGYPGYITFSAFNPERELGIAVFTNTLSPPQIFGGIVGLIKYAEEQYDEFSSDQAESDIMSDLDFSKFEGFYRGKWSIVAIRQFNQQLLLVTLTSEQPSQSLQRLKFQEENTFIVEEAMPTAGKGEKVYFEPDKLITRGMTLKRFEFEY